MLLRIYTCTFCKSVFAKYLSVNGFNFPFYCIKNVVPSVCCTLFTILLNSYLISR